MTITYVPGVYDEIAPGLQNMQKMLQSIFQPHRDFQVGLRNAIATNPQLLQQLIDMEHNNPGFLKSIHAGGLANIAGGMQESLANIQDKNMRQAVATMTPEQQAEANAKKLGFRSAAQVEQDALQNEATKASTTATKQQTDYYSNKLQQDKDQEAKLNQYRQVANNALLRIKSPSNIYSAIRSNAVTPDERVAFMSLPEFEKDIKFQQDEYWNQQRQQLQEAELARLRAQNGKLNVDDFIQRYNAQRAAEVADRAGNGVDVKAIYDLNTNQQLRSDVEKWKQPPSDKPDDIKLFNAMQAIRNNTIDVGRAPILQAKKAFEDQTRNEYATAVSRTADDSQRAAAVEMINNTARVLFEPLGVKPPVYAFDKAGDKTSTIFKDRTFYLKEADPKLASVGLIPSQPNSKTSNTISRGGKELASIDDAAAKVREANDKDAIIKQLKSAGYTDAEIGEIRTKSGFTATKPPRTATSVAPTFDPNNKVSAAAATNSASPYQAPAKAPEVSKPKADMTKVNRYLSDYYTLKRSEDKAKWIEDAKKDLTPAEYEALRKILRIQ